jgi:hypothetical protein
MTRRVYFSFHYEADVWRANQVRNSWVSKPDRESAGYYDAAEFEEVRKQGDAAIERWINRNLEGTSVTVVLVGESTCERRWVNYEIQRSLERGNGIIFIKIHNLRDQNGNTCREGSMNFDGLDMQECQVYDWIDNDGYSNLGDWVETCAQVANRPELGPPPKRYTATSSCGRPCQEARG